MSGFALLNYPELANYLEKVAKIEKCPCLVSANQKEKRYEIFIGHEREYVGYMPFNKHSPDGYYSFVCIDLLGDLIYNDIRRANALDAAEFAAVCVVERIAKAGHFKLRSFDSSKYWKIND